MAGHEAKQASIHQPGGPSADDILSQMERILADPSFEANARRRDLFRYLVEETVAGRGELLKGFTVALAVFGRDASFDSQSDPIVRIEARRLRSDLDGYYAGIGHRDRLRIVIPKGGYAPRAYWQGEADAPSSAATDTGSISDTGLEPLRELPPDPAKQKRRYLPYVAAAFAMVFVSGVAVAFWGVPRSAANAPAQFNAVPLVVLPFAASDSSADSEFLAQGMTQQLIADLMRFSGLRLYTATASFRQDPASTAAALGKDLGVAYVVRGSVAEDGDGLQVVADLENVATGQVVWSKAYDLPLDPKAVLKARADVSAQIASQLGQTYGAIKTDLSSKASATKDMDSYLCVLQAQTYRRTFDASMYGNVLSCLTSATQKDPTYADAWAMLGWLRLDAVRDGRVPASDATRMMSDAFAAAQKAVDLDANGVLGLQALSAINFYAGQYAESERLMRQALELNPNDPDTLVQFGWRLAARGNWDEGLPLVERGIAHTMSPPGWYFHSVAVHEYLTGDYAKAVEDANRSAKNGSSVGLAILAAAQGQLGDQAKASEALVTLAKLDPDTFKDPAALFRAQQVVEPTVTALMDGLKKAGWAAP